MHKVHTATFIFYLTLLLVVQIHVLYLVYPGTNKIVYKILKTIKKKQEIKKRDMLGEQRELTYNTVEYE